MRIKQEIEIRGCDACRKPFNGQVHQDSDGEYCTDCYTRKSASPKQPDKPEMCNGPAAFIQSLEWAWARPIMQVTGLCAIVNVTRTRFAKVILEELCRYGCPTQGVFTGFQVEIVDTEKGRIDTQNFLFDDVLTEEDRTEKRKPENCFDRGFSVYASSGWGWYIAVPKSTKKFCERVEGYIKRFKPLAPHEVE